MPATSEPPTLVIGEALLAATNERAVAFMVMRAIRILAVRGSALVRATSTDLAALVPAWFQSLVPGFAPQGINPTALAAAARKIALATPPPMNDELVSLGLEVASQLGTRASTLGGHVTSWANRAALLGVGDPNAALEAIAWSLGNKDGAPARSGCADGVDRPHARGEGSPHFQRRRRLCRGAIALSISASKRPEIGPFRVSARAIRALPTCASTP